MLTTEELIDEVKAALGRSDDTELITDARVLRWLNLAQEDIAERCPGLTALDFKNTTSIDFTAGKQSYSLSDWTSTLTTNIAGTDATTSNRICHIYNTFYIDGGNSVRLQFLPTDDYDKQYIDPTDDDYEFGIPKYWTRRGGNVEIYPVCSTAEDGKAFRLDGSLYPMDFTATDSSAYSSLSHSDDLLIAYAIFKAWSYIGKIEDAKQWLDKYTMLLNDYKDKNEVLHEWEANVYGEWK